MGWSAWLVLAAVVVMASAKVIDVRDPGFALMGRHSIFVEGDGARMEYDWPGVEVRFTVSGTQRFVNRTFLERK